MAELYKPYISDDSGSDSETDSDGYTTEESLLNVPGKNAPITTNMPENITTEPNYPKDSGTAFDSSESVNTSLIQIQSTDRDNAIYPQPTSFSLRLPRIFKNIKSINISQINLLNSFFTFSKALGNTNMFVYETGRTTIDSSGVPVPTAIDITIRDGSYAAQDLADEINNSMNNSPLFSDISLADFISQFQSTGDYTIPFNIPTSNVFNNLTNSFDSNQTIDTIVARYFQPVQTFGKTSFTYNETLVAYYYPVLKELIIKTLTPTFSVVGQTIPPGFTSWYDYIVFAFQGVDDPYITNIVTYPSNQAIFNAFRASNTFSKSLVNNYNVTYNTLLGRYNFAATGLCYSISNDLTNYYTSNLGSLVSGTTDPSGQVSGSAADFQENLQNFANSNTALTGFYNFIQTQFSKYFGVNFGQYSSEFYANSNNQLTIYDTLNKYGWNLSLTPQVSLDQLSSTQQVAQVENLWPNIYVSTSQQNFISTLAVPEFPTALNLLDFPNAGENTFGYVDVKCRIRPTTYSRVRFKTRCRQNISLLSIPRYINARGPGTEEVYNFGPGAGQTPLLFDTHSPGNTYILCDVSGNVYFNMYTVKQPIIDENMLSNQDPVYLRLNNHWITFINPQILSGSLLQAGDPNRVANPPISAITLTSYRPYIHFELDASSFPTSNARFSADFYIETQDGARFPVELIVSWYKDRAGFMADVPRDLSGDNAYDNDRHSFQVMKISTKASSAKMTIGLNNSQKTYFRVRTSNTINLPSSVPLRVFCVLTTNTPPYISTIATQNDKLDMPFSNLSTLSDQYTPASFTNPLSSMYDSNIFQLGYDISGVSNNLLDYIIQSGNSNYYDPNNIADYRNISSTGLRYMFDFKTNGAGPPNPQISSPQTWSLYFGSNSSNVVRDTYNNSNNVYLSSLQKPKPLFVSTMNESVLTNWFSPTQVTPGNIEPYERFLQPNINADYSTKISSSSVFLPCINNPPVQTDVKTSPLYGDTTGFNGLSFFLPPNQVLRLESFLIKFAYTQPSSDSAERLFRRTRSPLTLGGTNYNVALYRNQTTLAHTSNSPRTEWDDWYLYNRRNIKLGVFRTSDISGVTISTLDLSSALCTFTLEKVTQVNNYQDQLGTLKTREPGWGTWYTYKSEQTSNSVWDVSTVTWTGPSAEYWRSTITSADISPTYTDGENVYPNYFLTPTTINNYTYIPRSFGIAPAVGNAIYDPSLQSTFTGDIPNSFTFIPFYKDPATNVWTVGSFHGISYTRQPCLPDPAVIGAAPYCGPAGGYGWTNSGGNFNLHNGDSNNPMYYWNTKISYNTLDTDYNPATDLSSFGGYAGISGEYQDTMLFLYSNAGANRDLIDVSTVVAGNTIWKWGQESNINYQAFDDQSGYNFLSYIHDEPIRRGELYAVHIRAYDPIPEFTTGIRFIGKNYSDFGTLKLGELANEIKLLDGYDPISDAEGFKFIQNLYKSPPDYGKYTSTISTNNGLRIQPLDNIYFSHEYADALINFDRVFSTTVTFGKTNTFSGTKYTFSSFSEALKTYVNTYSTIQTNLQFYTTYLSTATGDLNQYVLTKYGKILPANIVERSKITDPLTFQFLFKSKLEAPYTTKDTNWGLGYNIGFLKADTSPPKTSITSDVFIKVVQDYIYLKLNPELNMNPLGISGKENLSETHDSMGEDGKYFAKILLNTFGSFTQTAVINPKTFNPVLGKFDMLRCQLYDKNNQIINNADCEFDFMLTISEVVNGPSGEASLLRPKKITP